MLSNTAGAALTQVTCWCEAVVRMLRGGSAPAQPMTTNREHNRTGSWVREGSYHQPTSGTLRRSTTNLGRELAGDWP